MAGKKKTDGDTGFDLERALAELEKLVENLEHGELSLEESLKAFEAGIKLTRQCQETLAAAEQKVQLLLEQNGALQVEPFNTDE